MNKKVITGIVGIILIGGSFFGGMKYDQAQMAAARASRTGGFAGRAGAGTFFAAGGGARGGNTFAMGSILSKDANSITIQMADGSGSTIAFLTASTTVMQTTTGSVKSLAVGQTVTVIGTKNSDGSLSANSIQLRQK